jgi:TadE-like protein
MYVLGGLRSHAAAGGSITGGKGRRRHGRCPHRGRRRGAGPDRARRLGRCPGRGSRRGAGPDRGGRRGAGPDRGSSAVELAILAPAVLLIIWLSVQFAFWYQGRQVALAAAQAGARVARQEANVTAAWRGDARNAAVGYYGELGTRVLGGRIMAVATGTPNDRVGVTVTGQVVSIVFGLKLTIHETAVGPVECFRPDLNGGQRCG